MDYIKFHKELKNAEDCIIDGGETIKGSNILLENKRNQLHTLLPIGKIIKFNSNEIVQYGRIAKYGSNTICNICVNLQLDETKVDTYKDRKVIDIKDIIEVLSDEDSELLINSELIKESTKTLKYVTLKQLNKFEKLAVEIDVINSLLFHSQKQLLKKIKKKIPLKSKIVFKDKDNKLCSGIVNEYGINKPFSNQTIILDIGKEFIIIEIKNIVSIEKK
jgi:hypothetical protein